MKSYFLCVDNEQTGPFSLSELRKMGIDQDTPIWKDGYIGWAKAGEVDGLKDFLPAHVIAVEASAKVKPESKNSNPVRVGDRMRRSLDRFGLMILKTALTGFLFMRGRKRSM